MKRIAVVGTLAAVLFAGSAAIAAPQDQNDAHHRDDQHSAQHDRKYDDRKHEDRSAYNDNRGGDHKDHWADHARDHRYDHAQPPRYRPAPPRIEHRAPPRYGTYYRPRGYVVHEWRRGERLPVAYYQPRYVVVDYRDCGLRVPPRGYHWVRVDGDAVLAAVTTGIVLETVFHVFG